MYRVVPQVHLDRSATASAAVCLILLTAGVHWFASWLYPLIAYSPDVEHASAAPRWHARWTAWLIGGVLLMFVAGLASVGVTHQVGWLLSTPEKLVIAAGPPWSGIASTVDQQPQADRTGTLQLSSAAHVVPARAEPSTSVGGRCTVGKRRSCRLSTKPIYTAGSTSKFPGTTSRNAAPYQTKLNVYLRPGIDREKDAAGYALTHYAANAAMLGGNVPRSLQNVSDGTSSTIMAGEVVSNFKPWGDPTNWRDLTLGINRSPNGFGSLSPDGANFLFVDGSVHFVRNTIKPQVLKAFSTPAGGEEVPLDQY